LNALSGKGVHVVTVNDYLAKRDAVWMGQIFGFLGLSIGVIQHESGYVYDASFKADAQDDEARDRAGDVTVQMDYLRPASRKDAYDADITYGTNNEFGFDYLRDNMATRKEHMVQRDLHFAIVDEIDSILIDEARTPLIVSAPAEESGDLYARFAQIVESIKVGEDYNIDEKMKSATFTEEGLQKVERALGIKNLYAEGLAQIHHAEQALKAHALFRKDRDYVVVDGEVKIVDEFTGRIMEGRRYSEGLHQAIEAKEGVEIKRESMTLATITFQNYFRMYTKLSGMTGTAATEAEEFSKIYNLEVVSIPTNMPIKRTDHVDKIFKSEKGKWLAVVDEVRARHEAGQPILIGTVSIERNELMDTLLTQAGIPHKMLNAKNHEQEAQIVAEAGKRGAVTVATNMAGRGVDIALGGRGATEEERDAIRQLGGLHVIGTERHESRRIDNQLRGRSGRQGDPGSTVFFVSLEDDLMRIFGAERVRKMMDTLRIDEKTPIESKMISNALEKAQQRVEGHHFDSRKHILEYDDVLNKHRKTIYERRRTILLKDDYDGEADYLELLEREVERVVLFHTGGAASAEVPEQFKGEQKGDWNPAEILEALGAIVPAGAGFEALVKAELGTLSKNKETLAKQRTTVIEGFMKAAKAKLEEVKGKFTDATRMNTVIRSVMLRTMDRAWVEHLEAMKFLRRGIGLQGYGQRDPLVEYKRESFGMFNALQQEIEHAMVTTMMRVLVQAAGAQATVSAIPPSIMEKARMMAGSGPVAVASKAMEKVGRNDACPCGSGKKYKKCHLVDSANV
jgi:preprotein translocase subunit SecA